MATLDIDRVSKRFGATEVLSEISIHIDSGDFLVLVGPSGCGKSTLLNMVAGLLPLSGGEIRLAGDRIDHLEPKDRNMAMVFQSYALYPAMTVGKNIAFPLRMAGVPKSEQDRKVAEVAELLQIGQLLNRKPSALSGGQRQRVAMGRALVRDPKLFLFDEPLSNLDAKLRVDMRTEIKRLHQRLKTTIIYVTHDQVEAMTMATKIAVMHAGAVQQFGTPTEIYERPANTFVATFMGSPAMNLLHGTITPDGSHVDLGHDLKIPVPPAAKAPAAGTKVLLGVRPEWFTLADEAGEGHAVLRGLVEVLEPTGPDIYVSLMIGSLEAHARLPAGTQLSEGETRNFAIALDNAVLFDADSGEALYR